MSLADLVTDAVVEPQPLNHWIPDSVKKVKQKAPGGEKRAFGHVGILSAADAVLADLKANGILTTLLQPDECRGKSLEVMRARSQASLRPVQSTRSPSQQKMTRRKNLDEALSDAERGEAGLENGKPRSHQEQSGSMRRNTEGSQAGGVWPSKTFPKGTKPAEDSAHGSKKAEDKEGDEMVQAAQTAEGSPEEQGEDTGAALQKNLDTKGWRLVVTGHSLGGGAAALMSLQMLARYPDLKCWAFSPPGGLISRSLLRWAEGWCTSVVVGKDAVPRMTVNNLNRLMDEMVTSLARCRQHKLRILLGGWRGEKRTPPHKLFFPYNEIPEESKGVLEQYQKGASKQGKARDMFPPGRLLFLRPIKMLDKEKQENGSQDDPPIRQVWDAVWSSSEELIAEGILMSKKMLNHHSITSALLPALGYSIRHHPDNPKSEDEKRQDEEEQEELQDDLESVGDDHGAPANPLSGPSTRVT